MNIQRIHSKLFVLSISVAVFAGLLNTGSLVHAAKPVCYERINPGTGVTGTVVRDCLGNPNFNEILKNIHGAELKDDTCYIIETNVNGITAGDPFGSDICNQAENARTDKAATPAPAPTTTTPAAPSTNTSTSGTSSNTAATGGSPSPNPSAACAPNDTKCSITRKDDEFIPKDTTDLQKIVDQVIVLLSYVVGIVVVIMIIAGGIRYSSAGGDPNAVSSAKKMIFNAILALILFIFLRAMLNWIVPGGVG